MAEEQVKVEQKMSSLEQLYNKYFSKGKKLLQYYHRTQELIKYRYEVYGVNVVLDREVDTTNELEAKIRKAVSMGFDGKKTQNGEFSELQILAIYSVLANLPKIQDKDLKKSVLAAFRKYLPYDYHAYDRDAISRVKDTLSDIHLMVANAAVANGVATTMDYETLIVAGKQHQYMDALIAQAKADIKAEMALDVPLFEEIRDICGSVKKAAYAVNVPDKTKKLIEKEFDSKLIIAGIDTFAQTEKEVEKTLEMKYAKQEFLENKASWVDVVAKDNENLKQENAALKKQLKEVVDRAHDMRASLLSVGVNKYKRMIAEMVQPVKIGHTK